MMKNVLGDHTVQTLTKGNESFMTSGTSALFLVLLCPDKAFFVVF